MNRSFSDGKTALGGMLTALSVVCMFLTNVIPVAEYALPALAGVVIMVAVVELGYKGACMVYAASAALSLLLVSNLEAVLMYVLLFGYYSILKSVFEKLRRPYFCIGLKFAVFNLAVILVYFLAIGLLGLPAETFELFGTNVPLLFLVLGNVVFAIYDVGLTRLVTCYCLRYHDRVRNMFRLPK